MGGERQSGKTMSGRLVLFSVESHGGVLMGERWQPLSSCLMAVPTPMAVPVSSGDNKFVDQLFKLSGFVVLAAVAFIFM